LDDHHPQPDECDYLDQVVLVCIHDGQVGLPMYPGIATGLPPKEHHDSTWYAATAPWPTVVPSPKVSSAWTRRPP
jgi:hypothetical protein